MYTVRLLPEAQQNLQEIFAFTLARFGVAKYLEYTELVEEALAALAADPQAGRSRPDLRAEAWIYHIGQRGRRARHVLLYRILESERRIEVRAVLHDAMDLPQRS